MHQPVRNMLAYTLPLLERLAHQSLNVSVK